MNIRGLRNTLLLGAFVAAVAFAAAPQRAYAQSIPGTSGPSSTSSPDVFFFSLSGNTVTEMNTGTALGLPATYISTTDGTPTATYMFSFDPGATPMGQFDELDSSSNSLIEGTFSGLTAAFVNTSNGTSVFVTGNVVYTGGSELSSAGYTPGETGSLGVTLSDVNGTGTTNDYGSNSYGVSYTTNPPGGPQGLQPVPEVSSALTIGIALCGLGGLVMFSRRKSAIAL